MIPTKKILCGYSILCYNKQGDSMGLICKSLRRDEFKNIIKKEIHTIQVNNDSFEGTVSLMKILDVQEPMIVSYPTYKVTILDKNYQWLQFAPKGENWWLTVLYDDSGNLIESYFDITKQNIFEDELNPTFIDMRLDVVLSKDRESQILDEDELKEALDEKLITKEEYEFAFFLAKSIIQGYNRNKAKYYEFIDRYYQELQK